MKQNTITALLAVIAMLLGLNLVVILSGTSVHAQYDTTSGEAAWLSSIHADLVNIRSAMGSASPVATAMYRDDVAIYRL